MLKPHTEILDKKRLSLFKKLKTIVQNNWIIGGGTAIALQIIHRKSYDFDIFLPDVIPPNLLLKINKRLKSQIRPVINTEQELSVIVDEQVKLTFIKFPFPPLHKPVKTSFINIYSLPDLASNKAYAMGRRNEWKDYVDFYCLLTKAGINLEKTINETKKRFGGNFDEKLFWEQLVFWKDLKDFQIEYIGKTIPKIRIQKYFKNLTLKKFF